MSATPHPPTDLPSALARIEKIRERQAEESAERDELRREVRTLRSRLASLLTRFGLDGLTDEQVDNRSKAFHRYEKRKENGKIRPGDEEALGTKLHYERVIAGKRREIRQLIRQRDEARALLAFAVERHRAYIEHRVPRCTGRSSDALADLALGGGDRLMPAPYDASDLLACEITYEMAPEFVRPLMLPLLEAHREGVYARYPESRAEIEQALRDWRAS
jgi:hypothetical protein